MRTRKRVQSRGVGGHPPRCPTSPADPGGQQELVRHLDLRSSSFASSQPQVDRGPAHRRHDQFIHSFRFRVNPCRRKDHSIPSLFILYSPDSFRHRKQARPRQTTKTSQATSANPASPPRGRHPRPQKKQGKKRLPAMAFKVGVAVQQQTSRTPPNTPRDPLRKGRRRARPGAHERLRLLHRSAHGAGRALRFPGRKVLPATHPRFEGAIPRLCQGHGLLPAPIPRTEAAASCRD